MPPADKPSPALAELMGRHRNVELGLKEGPAGITIERMRVAPELQREGHATRALQDLIAHADRTGQALGVTAKRDGDGANQKTLHRWLRKHGFANNIGKNANEALSTGMVRAPREREQTVAAERPAPSIERPPDPLDRFRSRLPDRYVAQMGQQALSLAPATAKQTGKQLQARLAHAERRLARAPLLSDEVAKWGGTHGRDAAKVLALEAEATQEQGSGSSLDRWAELFTDDQRKWLQGNAATLRAALQDRDAAFIQRQRIQLEQSDPFGELRKVVGKWSREKAEPAAQVVAIKNELGRRDWIARIEGSVEAGERVREQPAAEARDLPLDRFVDDHWDRLGERNVKLTFDSALGIQEQLKDKDPAVLQAWANQLDGATPERDAYGTACALAARQELHERAHPELARKRDERDAEADQSAEPVGMAV